MRMTGGGGGPGERGGRDGGSAAQAGQSGVQIGPIARIRVLLCVEDPSAAAEHHQPTLLPRIALRRGLKMASESCPQGARHAADGEGFGDAPPHAQCAVALSSRVGVDAATTRQPLRESRGGVHGSIADEYEVSPGRLDLPELATQLRSRVLAVESTKVTQETDDRGPRLGNPGQADRVAIEVEDGELGIDGVERGHDPSVARPFRTHPLRIDANP